MIEGNRTLIECTTNICPTIRRQSPYNRCVFEVRTQLVILMRDNSFPLSHAIWVKCWIRTNVKGFADLHLNHLGQPDNCSSIRIWTLTSSFVVKGAIHYTIELLCTPWKIRTFICGFGDRYATIAPKRYVGIVELESTTFCVSGRCSNQLSYIPMCDRFPSYRCNVYIVTSAMQSSELFGRVERTRTSIVLLPKQVA